MNSQSLYFFPPLTTLIDFASDFVPPPTPLRNPPMTGPSHAPVGLSSDSGFTSWSDDDWAEEAVWVEVEFCDPPAAELSFVEPAGGVAAVFPFCGRGGR